MSVKNADIKSLSSERVNLLDLDYYSITDNITETDLFARIKNFSQGCYIGDDKFSRYYACNNDVIIAKRLFD